MKQDFADGIIGNRKGFMHLWLIGCKSPLRIKSSANKENELSMK